MNKNDIEFINKIIELTKKIFKIYNTLYELEIDNKKDNIEYQNNLKYLDLLLEMEDGLYSSIPINKLDLYIEYSNRAKTFRQFSDFTLIINDFNDNYVFKRIYNRLFEKRNSFLILEYQNDFEVKQEPYFDLINILYKVMHEDMLNSFIYETNKLSKTIDNSDYKNGLIMIKYLASFLNKNIEQIYKNNFNVNDNLYIYNQLLSDNFDIKNKYYLNTINNYYFNIIYREIKNISKNDLYTSDYSFQNYRHELQICFIKAFNNLIKDNDYLKTKIRDIIIKNNIDINIDNIDDNVINIRSERLDIYGSSK